MTDGQSTETRLTLVEREVEALKTAQAETRGEIRQLRERLESFGSDMNKSLSDVKQSLHVVVTGTLNSMPPWAAVLMSLALIVATAAGVIALVHH